MTNPTDQVLAENLITLSIAIDSVRAAISRELDFTPQQIELLCSLGHGPKSVGTLAGLMGCDKTNVTGLVDRLERRKLVKRQRDNRDRRVVHVLLSDAGDDVVKAFRLRSAEALTESLSGWSRGERDQLSALARKSIDAVNPRLSELLDS